MTVQGLLRGLRVVEHCGWNGVFAGRLLAEAGADVVRIVGPGGDPLADEPPFFGETGTSIHDTWYNAGKRIVTADSDSALRDIVRDLVPRCEVFIEDWGDDDRLLTKDEIASANPYVVHLSVRPFGSTGPWSGYASTDLVGNALSGSASVSGNSDTPPLSGYGNQTYHTVGLYVATCALAALRASRITGESQHVQVNAHEALVSCTEQVLMEWFFPDGIWKTAIAPRQGSLHWSGTYEVYPAKTGGDIMVTAGLRLFDSLLPWLEEEGAAQDLADREKYPDPVSVIRDLPYLMDVIRDWVATRDAGELFREAQEHRHQPFGVVWDVARAVASPQARARGYFRPRDVPGFGTVQFPGHMLRTDVDGDEANGPPTHTNAKDLEWPTAPVMRRETTAAPVAPQRPLEGVRILDFTHVLAGPFGTRVLADLGADVIKVTTAARGTGANAPGHPYYVCWNRNKRSITLDLGSEKGLDVARQLALKSDVIIENFRAGVLARWGLDRASLKAANPGISVIAMGGMGQTGPWKDYVTYAPTIHALVGLTYLTNPPGRYDLGYGFSLTDHLSGLAGAFATCAAVEHRDATGQGTEIDLSQYELGLSIMAPAYLDYFANGRNPEPVGNRHPFDAWAPHGIYRCEGTDEWVAVAVRGDDQWRRLVEIMGTPELAADPRFAAHGDRIANQDALDATVESWMCSQDRYSVMDQCQAAGIAAGPVQNARDLTQRDPQLQSAGFFDTATGARWGEYGLDRFPATFSGERPQHYEGVHEVGADTFDVLAEILGLDDGTIAELVAEGVLS